MAQRESSASSYHTASGFMAANREAIADDAIVQGGRDRERRISNTDSIDSIGSADRDLLEESSE